MKKKGLNKTAAIFAHEVVNQEPVVGNSLSDCWRMYYEEYGHLHQRNEVQINTQLVTQGLSNINISPAVQNRTHLNMGQQTTHKGMNVASDPQNLTPTRITSAPQSSSKQILNKLAHSQIKLRALCSILGTTPEQLFNPHIMVPINQPSTNFLNESSPHERQGEDVAKAHTSLEIVEISDDEIE
ncbi:uncharacterized protein [Rutidosis leptorrhynchoides]|uniref:uncharacterized protein n=1 Tax=Rutidosis leptorrhynchoides TaxID=125765 RepID=UPI003A99CF44